MAAYQKFNQFVADAMNKQHDFSSDVFKLMLTNVAPVAGNSVVGDITEIAAGNGYTAGGEVVTIASSTQTGGLYSAVPSADVVFTATGNVAAFRYAVLYNSTAGKLVSFYDRGSEVNMINGETFTVDVAATLFTLS